MSEISQVPTQNLSSSSQISTTVDPNLEKILPANSPISNFNLVGDPDDDAPNDDASTSSASSTTYTSKRGRRKQKTQSPGQEASPQNIHIINDNNCGENYNPSSNFRLANQKILLTYKYHLPKDEFKQWATTNLSGYKVCEMAHEVGKHGGDSGDLDYDHTHVLIDFGRIFQTTNARRFDYLKGQETIHPHIKKIKNKTHWERCCNYLAKEDPDNSHLKRETNIVTSVFNADNLTEALSNNAKKFSDINGIIALHNLKPVDKLDLPKPDRKWSTELMAYLENNPPDDRHIIWIYDQIGEGGKSRLVKYLCNEFPDKYKFTRGAPVRDAATDIHNAIKSGWNQHCYFYDLPRACEDKKFYEPLEDIKDGMLSVTKYNSQQLLFKSPHVVVLANFLPNVNSLSKDRWWVFEINPNKQDWRRLSDLEVETKYKEQQNKKKNPPTDSLLTFVN